MKKLLSFVLVIYLIAACLLTFVSCGKNSELVGTYEMSSISGLMSYNGQTIELDEDLYEYYRITLKRNGSCKIESKAADSSSKIEQEGTWEYFEESGILAIKSEDNGVTVIEEMKWKDGIITYDVEQTVSSAKIKMRLKLKKQYSPKHPR